MDINQASLQMHYDLGGKIEVISVLAGCAGSCLGEAF